MRALHLIKTGSGAKWALLQMRELVRLGVEVHAALPPGASREAEYRAAGVVVHHIQTDLPIRRPYSVPTHLGRIRNLVKEVNPDVIHSHFVGTTLAMRLALGKRHPVPRIFQVPGPLHLEHPFFARAEVNSAGVSDYWIGTCRFTCDRYLEMGVRLDRLFLRYYGKDMDSFELERPRGRLRRMVSIPRETKIVGMVAYMYPPKRYLGHSRGIKGHEDLIDALELGLDQGWDIAGVFVGGGTKSSSGYERRLRAYGRQKLGDRAIFLGSRNDVSDLYPDFDVAVHPSHSENQGGAAESLLLGIPTIATNVGGFPDIVQPGITGILVPPKDPRHLCAAIGEMIASPSAALTMALEGRKVMQEIGNAKHNAAKVYETYKTILSHRDGDH